ncbi:MAG: YIP1 family protein [Bacteroidetes bacterium]|nr:YIP1 family protein [Bacteroidota bacterium]
MEPETSAVDTGFFNRLVNIFFNPTKTFESILHQPSWALPWICIFLLHSFSLVVLKDVYVVEKAKIVREALAKNQNMTDEQKEQAVEMTQKLWFIDLIFLFFWFLIMILLGGLILKIIGNNLLGGTLDFAPAASLFAWVQFIDIPMWLVKGPLIYVTESLRADTGLGLLIPNASLLSVQYVFLSSFDLFSIWKLVLVGLGLAFMTKASTQKTFIVVGLIWLAWVAARTGLATVNVHLP